MHWFYHKIWSPISVFTGLRPSNKLGAFELDTKGHKIMTFYYELLRESALTKSFTSLGCFTIGVFQKRVSPQALMSNLMRFKRQKKRYRTPSKSENQCTVKPYQKFGYQIDYALPKTHPSVNIFIQLNQIPDQFSSLIDSLLRHTAYDNYQITFLCNKKIATDFQSISDKIAPHINHEIFIPENDTTSLNQCVNSSKSDYICLVDEICLRFSENWLQKLLSIAAQPGTGSVSPQVLYKNGYIFSNGIVFGAAGLVNHLFNGISEAAPDYYFGWVKLNKQFSALPHHCLVFRKSDFTEVGGFELSLSNQVTKTIDFCLKLQNRGLGNLLVPEVKHLAENCQGRLQ